MRKVGIIQPGRLGDIIICLPIARWFFERGYEVIWPIQSSYLSNFIEYVDYARFIPIGDLDCSEARKICLPQCNTLLDLSITMLQSHPLNDNFFHQNQHKLSFDAMKYLFANVPFEEKWNLKFNRNPEREEKLLKNLAIPDGQFTLVHMQGSSESFAYKGAVCETLVVVDQLTASIFDWCGVIERAGKIVAIDSSFANLVEQFGYDGPKYLVRRTADIRPFYRNWNVL